MNVTSTNTLKLPIIMHISLYCNSLSISPQSCRLEFATCSSSEDIDRGRAATRMSSFVRSCCSCRSYDYCSSSSSSSLAFYSFSCSSCSCSCPSPSLLSNHCHHSLLRSIVPSTSNASGSVHLSSAHLEMSASALPVYGSVPARSHPLSWLLAHTL